MDVLLDEENVRYSYREDLVSVAKIFFFRIMNSGAERFNGLMAMLGIVAGIGAYTVTGQMIPGIF